MFDAYLPLIRYESRPGSGLAICKYILAKRGAIAHAFVRAPGPTLTAASIAEVETLIARLAVRIGGL